MEDQRGGVTYPGSHSLSMRDLVSPNGVTANNPLHTTDVSPPAQSGSKLLIPELRWLGKGDDIGHVCSGSILSQIQTGRECGHRCIHVSPVSTLSANRTGPVRSPSGRANSQLSEVSPALPGFSLEANEKSTS